MENVLRLNLKKCARNCKFRVSVVVVNKSEPVHLNRRGAF